VSEEGLGFMNENFISVALHILSRLSKINFAKKQKSNKTRDE